MLARLDAPLVTHQASESPHHTRGTMIRVLYAQATTMILSVVESHVCRCDKKDKSQNFGRRSGLSQRVVVRVIIVATSQHHLSSPEVVFIFANKQDNKERTGGNCSVYFFFKIKCFGSLTRIRFDSLGLTVCTCSSSSSSSKASKSHSKACSLRLKVLNLSSCV